MKIQNLFLFLLLALSITVVSCGDDDEVEDGCVLCTFDDLLPLTDDCEITVCEDGTFESNGATICIATTGISGTQDSVIIQLEALSFDCPR